MESPKDTLPHCYEINGDGVEDYTILLEVIFCGQLYDDHPLRFK